MADKQFVQQIADINTDFPQWYTDVVLKTEMVDYGPVKGTMVIRPYGYAVWELIQQQMDARFKATGHTNAYFPLLIPESFLSKEAEHVEGFAPEVAWVTHGGNEPLAERLVVRPTSETIICHMYSKWVQSWRDLPLLYNQWCNVVRWEKATRPFLRTSEFLWQEGHTIHATEEEAREETLKMLEVYREFAENVLAIPVFCGRKSEKEKFAGAAETYSIEAMMLDGKALQAGTSHFLGDHFSKVFDIKFLDKDGTQKYVYQTSWGTSTRMIGGVVMVHGDERGLKFPPAIAPIQTVIIPVAAHKEGVTEKAEELFALLKKNGIRVNLDDRDFSPGWKFNEWEMKGVPVRLEIGPKDIEKNQCVLVRRDTHEKLFVSLDNIETTVAELLAQIQKDMLETARAHRDAHTTKAENWEEFVKAIEDKNFVFAPWCGETECEAEIKSKTGATTRNVPFENFEADGCTCVHCGKKAHTKIYFAKSY